MPKKTKGRTVHKEKRNRSKVPPDLGVRHRLTVVDYAVIGTFAASIVVPITVPQLQQGTDAPKVASVTQSRDGCQV